MTGRAGIRTVLLLLCQLAASRTFELLTITMFINHAANCSLLSMAFPLSLLLYGLLDSPRPAPTYFSIMLSYTLLLITAKFAYQIPIFCGSPPFTYRTTADPAALSSAVSLARCVDPTASQASFQASLARRIDFIIGLHKFTRHSSLGDVGTFAGLLPDLLTLIALIAHRQVCRPPGRSAASAPCTSPPRRVDSSRASRSCAQVVRARGECGSPSSEQADSSALHAASAALSSWSPSVRVPAAIAMVRGFSRRLLPPLAEAKKGADTHIGAFVLCLVLLLFNFLFFSSLPEQPKATCAASDIASQLNNSQVDIPTVLAVWACISVMMVCDTPSEARARNAP